MNLDFIKEDLRWYVTLKQDGKRYDASIFKCPNEPCFRRPDQPDCFFLKSIRRDKNGSPIITCNNPTSYKGV